VVLRQEHKAGEKMFVDWAGATIPVYDASSGQAWPASLFVSVLGASSYAYAEATRDQQLQSWIQMHIHALEFYGGAPTLTVPDNTRTAVTRACRYDPDLNPTYQEFALHYGMGVVPARPYRPRDKAKVESGVQVCERWIIAALRHRKFFNLGELNQAIRELLARPTFPQAGRIAVQSVSQPGETGSEPVTGRALRHERVEAGHRQHRLPHCLRWELLQCALYPGAATRGSPLHSDHSGDLS
jgi:transposase